VFIKPLENLDVPRFLPKYTLPVRGPVGLKLTVEPAP
jgi:hypothetical protein